MTVHFIGAGPGAPDLITVRGLRLIERCPVCLYAGSLVPREIVAATPPGARVIDTAPLTLDEIITEIETAHRAGIDIPPERATYGAGCVFDRAAPQSRLSWNELVTIAHRNFHRLPPGTEPGLAFTHVMQVPTGGQLPTADGRVQMYPCFAFEFHLILVAVDPDLGKPEIKRYFIGHDCGTVINPKIVRGMTMGGIAHGIGAALYEEFAYNEEGQLIAQSFMDYLLPSSHEVPPVEIVHHVTPSPHTVFGQKGSGESGYLGAPAAIASAINDAIRPLGIAVNSLPIRIAQLGDMIAAAREKMSPRMGSG